MIGMKQNNPSVMMAIGGIFAALAVTVMLMGTLIPVATYVCPVICMLLLQTVMKTCGTRIGWAWYGSVAILSLLLAPDKESAIVFGFLGYYPIIKSRIDQRKGKWILKAMFFNGSVMIAYWFMLKLLGLKQVVNDLKDSGWILTSILLILGNITFFLLDWLLATGLRQFKRR